MILNRYKLRRLGVSEEDIGLIQNKCRLHKEVEIFDKMVTSDRGYLVSTPHFRLDELIEAIGEFVKVCKSFAVAKNKRLLKVLEDLKGKECLLKK